ncbi:hypothetical protein PVAND_001732 [Polypedilum vanderplanki]|uniref:Uncharacterized protein n=1 Tax=Polypedilum vanderplanki TaxID=319348 RepID=A0A9J6BQ44_POLVA|nr:hypothetical protein PVAND_001732 [Polypedilum vanderplanki]
MQTRMSVSRDASPVGSEISVGSPSPPPSEFERSKIIAGQEFERSKIIAGDYFQPLKRLKMVADEDNNNCSSDASRIKSPTAIKSSTTTTTNIEGVKSFSIADILGRDSNNSSNKNSSPIVNGLSHLHHHHQQQQHVARIVRPWDHLQHPISIRPLLPPALLIMSKD